MLGHYIDKNFVWCLSLPTYTGLLTFFSDLFFILFYVFFVVFL